MAWTAPRTWTTAEIVTAGMMNEQVRDNELYLKTETDKLDDVSQGDVTGSRAIDGTVYQNTSGKIRIVTVQCVLTKTNAAQYSRVTFCSDANASPTTQIGRMALQPDTAALGGDLIVEMAFTFVVPPNYYYKATETHTGDVSTLSDWFEWDLH